MTTPQEKIAKLEGLLLRVKERAEAPRPRGAAIPAASAHVETAHAEVAHAEPVEAAASPTAPPPASRAGTVPPTSGQPEVSTGWSEPPPVTAQDPVLETSETDEDFDPDDVEVSAEVVEVDIDIDEPGLMPAESGAQLVAVDAKSASVAPAEPAAELEEVHDDEVPAEAAIEAPEELGIAAASAPPAANEIVEPEPSSSPRPIASEQPEAYEAESAPRHTPPPESGKQVAAPSVKPEAPAAAGRSSLPPASLEGHTLIGGWREPGMAFPRDKPGAGAPAVRVPPAAAPGGAVVAPPPPPPPPPAAPASPGLIAREPSVLEPQITKVEFPETAVATFEGAAPTLAAATFGDLLDATLAL
jgi:flagellar protein FliO/FliZ